MTPDNTNIGLLVVEPLVALVLITCLHVRKVDLAEGRWKRQIGMGVLTFTIFLAVFPNVCLHRCHNGQPFTHIVVGQICILPVLLLVRQGRLRLISGAFVMLLAWGAATHFNALVHSGRFIGTTDVRGINNDPGLEPVRVTALWHSKFSHLYSLETRKKEPSQAPEDAARNLADPER
jgi:hypothetical protein